MSKPQVKIDNWRIIGEALFGEVQGHPRFAQGQFVRTSRIASVDREKGEVETQNTIYLLGKEACDDSCGCC